MPVNPITVTSPTPPANAIAQDKNKATTTTAAPDQFGKDTFLKLLVAQLKYQNPLSPSDPTQFLAQTAQFTMVEKLNDIASSGSVQTTAQQQLTAATMIGKNVAWSIDGQTGSGMVTSAKFTSDGAVVVVGGNTIPLADVTEIAAATPPATGAAATSATTSGTAATGGAPGSGTGTAGAASTDAATNPTSSSAPPAADQPTT
jgi:flagellar basal-body rod modification protein FlgD